MADDLDTTNAADAGDEEQPKKGGRMRSILLLLVGLGMGSAAGLMFVGPLVAGGSSAGSSDDGHAEDSGGHGAPADDGHGSSAAVEDGVDPLLHMIPNIIVNPSGSGGNRLLLLDVALRLDVEHAVVELTGRDAEVRDAVIHLLGAKSVSELAEISTRDALKTEMMEVVSELLSTGHVTAIFFPRYVIQ